ncbi:MAG TPA: CPBP family intramembrane glutamic endopeptidase [Candidatus Dormibacteraeota bacterium]|nr:CPBP family intramembrane glutamic endopeptidase [Candidatus Dormibacteraeota bacterium]
MGGRVEGSHPGSRGALGYSDQPTGRSEPAKQSASLVSRSLLVAFCLVAALTYRASVSVIPSGVLEDAFVLVLSAVLLALAAFARRSDELKKFWEIPFAFFVFTLAGFFGDGSISPLQHLFVRDVLHQTTSTNNPLASTVMGTVLAQVVGTLLLAVPIIVLTRASGADLRSIFLTRSANWWGVAVGVACFVIVYFLVVRGRTASFFPTHGAVTMSRLLSLTPALVVLVLLNGFREELWFRGLFLNRYGAFLGPLSSNVLAAVIFTSFHVQVQYAASILPFLVYTLINGLILGWLMQRSRSILASAIFHAGTDIPIFLVYLTYAAP